MADRTPATLRAIAYTRVSTGRQAASGLGLTDQMETILRHAAARGWTVIQHAEDAGLSGREAFNRPALNDAMAALDKSEAEVLVAAKLDRLSRSTVDLARILQRAKKRGWMVAVLDADVDTTTPSGELIVSVLGAVAAFESARIGERVAAAHAQRRTLGLLPGPAPGMTQELRARIVGMRQQGVSLQGVADVLNEERVPTVRPGARWHASTVRHVQRSVIQRGS